SPIEPVRPIRSRRMTFSWGIPCGCPVSRTVRRSGPSASPAGYSASACLLDGIGHDADEAGALDGLGQFALLLGRNGGNAARNDLAALGNIAAEQADVLVVDLWRAFARERASLAAAL